MVKLEDGSEVSLDELKECYRFLEKCRAKSRELKNFSDELRRIDDHYIRRAELLKMQQDKLHEFLEELIPSMPDKALKKTNPVKYQKRVDSRNEARRQLKALMDSAAEDHRKVNKYDRKGMRVYAESEERQLLDIFPMLRNPEARERFNQVTRATALHFDFSEQEFDETHDHRVFHLLFYAWNGLMSGRSEQLH